MVFLLLLKVLELLEGFLLESFYLVKVQGEVSEFEIGNSLIDQLIVWISLSEANKNVFTIACKKISDPSNC